MMHWTKAVSLLIALMLVTMDNGERVNVWNDFWLPSGSLRNQIQGPLAEGEGNLTIKDFLADERSISLFSLSKLCRKLEAFPLR